MLKTWSISGLQQFEKCAAKVKYQKIDRLPTKGSVHLDRGIAAHDAIEQFIITSEEDYLNEDTEHFQAYIEDVLAGAEEDGATVYMEEMWTFDKAWNYLGVTDFDAGEFAPGTHWHYQKHDLTIVSEDESFVHVRDWKTGKVRDEAVDQMDAYAVGVHQRWPDADIEVTLVYLDSDELKHLVYDHALVGDLRAVLTKRASKMLKETKFPATKGWWCGKWCDFSKVNGGPCKIG